jgi:hypothetical protein
LQHSCQGNLFTLTTPFFDFGNYITHGNIFRQVDFIFLVTQCMRRERTATHPSISASINQPPGQR